jgi:FMN phosphatase YigB (HAD superfamily)
MRRPVLLVDFGGVLVHTTDDSVLDEWQRVLALGQRSVTAAIFDNEMSRAAMAGQIPADSLLPTLAAHLSLSRPQMLDLWETFWRSQGPNEPLIQYLQGIKLRVSIAVCSNFWPNYQDIMFKRYALDRVASDFFISSELKCTKPFPAFFDAVRERYAPEKQLALVDDLEWNVAGAERSSIHGIHHSTTDLTIQRIENWLARV